MSKRSKEVCSLRSPVTNRLGAFIATVVILLMTAAPVYAQTPAPSDGGGAIDVPQDELPYDFQPYDYSTTGNLDELNLFSDATFVNSLGSTILTLFSLLDSQNVLPIFVVLLLALGLLWKVYRFTVSGSPSASGVDFDYLGDDEQWEKIQTKNPFVSILKRRR